MMNYGNQRNAIAQALMNVRNPQPRPQMAGMPQRPPMTAQITPQLQPTAPVPPRVPIPQFGMGMGQQPAAPAPAPQMPIGPPAPQSPMAPQMPMASPPPMDNSMGTLPQDTAQYPPMGV